MPAPQASESKLYAPCGILSPANVSESKLYAPASGSKLYAPGILTPRMPAPQASESTLYAPASITFRLVRHALPSRVGVINSRAWWSTDSFFELARGRTFCLQAFYSRAARRFSYAARWQVSSDWGKRGSSEGHWRNWGRADWRCGLCPCSGTSQRHSTRSASSGLCLWIEHRPRHWISRASSGPCLWIGAASRGLGPCIGIR